MKCDRCYRKIRDTQIYDIQIGIPLTPVSLCKDCVDEYKRMLSAFRGYGTSVKTGIDYNLLSRASREKTGDADMYKYNILPRVYAGSNSIPPDPIEPKHEGRKPTNIFSKLFYMMFFEKVKDP